VITIEKEEVLEGEGVLDVEEVVYEQTQSGANARKDISNEKVKGEGDKTVINDTTTLGPNEQTQSDGNAGKDISNEKVKGEGDKTVIKDTTTIVPK